jgi:hypothetical protein
MIAVDVPMTVEKLVGHSEEERGADLRRQY